MTTYFQTLIVGVLSFLSGWALSLFLTRKLFAQKNIHIKKLEEQIHGRKRTENTARPNR